MVLETGIMPAGGLKIAGADCAAAGAASLPSPGELRQWIQLADHQGLLSVETLLSLLAAIEQRDPATARHSHRTAAWCVWLAGLAQVEPRDVTPLVVAALLHDLGKIGIEDELLRKPGRLEEHEIRVMRQYRSISSQLAAACRADARVVHILECHDTPDSSTDTARPEPTNPLGRILAVADAFDAMVSDQHYRKALSRSDALEQLRCGDHRRFDPDIVHLLEVGLAAMPDPLPVASAVLPDFKYGQTATTQTLLPSGTAGIAEALNLVSDAVWLVDGELRIRMWNERAEALTGFSAREMVGTVWSGAAMDYVGQLSLPREQRRSLVTRCLDAGTNLTERGYLWNARGDCIPVESRVMLMRDESQQNIGALEIIRDLSREISLQSENEQLRRVTQMDPLTQVLNRAAFEQTLKDQVESVNRHSTRCSLILLDIDFFKSVNDTFGHPVGDLVLKSFANLLAHQIRPKDVVARYGGEEFALLLPDCNLATAYDRAEHLRTQFPSLHLPELKGQTITASLGVTEIQSGDTDSGVVVRADEALYRAKEHGRNRTEVAYAGTPKQSDHEFACGWTVTGSAELAVLKLSGFMRLWRAHYIQSNPGSVQFQIGQQSILQRVGLRPSELPVEVKLTFARTHISERTQVQVAIRALVGRPDAREFHLRCCEILATLRSYLMADPAASTTTQPVEGLAVSST